jgi:hypothetical protein
MGAHCRGAPIAQTDRVVARPATWTDYLGPQPYVDYTIESGSPPVIEEEMRYLAGLGVYAQGSADGLSAEPSRDRQGAELAADAGLGGPALLGAGGPLALWGENTALPPAGTTPPAPNRSGPCRSGVARVV